MEYAVELLAPAGNMACLHAAVQGGANAVYLGTQDFNARRTADNFTLETLKDACDYAHVRGVKIFLTLNTVIIPSEVHRALEVARQAYRAGVDAFIVQDLGLTTQLRRILPQAELHISTQMNVHNEAGVRAMAALGAKRVTFARELNLEEIGRLTELSHQLGMETEVFAHGALCICYSGQCLMSSMVGGRSANRGMCAQPCRLPYTLYNRAQRKPLPSDGDHLLSPKDRCTIDILPQLLATGVDSLKIEGRRKSEDYVFGTVQTYRAVLDRLYKAAAEGGVAAGVTPDERRHLTEVFSRGFTTAYLDNESGNDMMGFRQPNNRGVFLGRIQKAANGCITFQAEVPVNDGDLLGVWTNRGNFTVDTKGMDDLGNNRYRIPCTDKCGKGDRVFRLRNAAGGMSNDPMEPRVPVSAVVTLLVGKPLSITVTAGDASVYKEGAVVEPARTRAVTIQDVRDHVDRLGSTPFAFVRDEDLTVVLDEGVGIGFSALHHLRADALEELAETLAKRAVGDRTLTKVRQAERPHDYPPHRPAAIAALATNPACARAAKRAGAKIIYVPVLNEKRGEAVVAGQLSSTVEQAGYPKQSIPVLPVVNHDLENESREQKFEFDCFTNVREGKPVVVQNLGQLVQAEEMGAVPEVGSFLPVTNPLTLEAVTALGASRVWLSPELALGQIDQVLRDSTISAGITIIGNQQLMLTEHCLLQSQGECNFECTTCARRRSPHFLKDRKDYEMPVITDRCGRSHLYNAVRLDIAHLLPDLLQAGIDTFLVDTTLMNVEETTTAVRRAVHALDMAQKSGNTVGKQAGATTGHIFRGVE